MKSKHSHCRRGGDLCDDALVIIYRSFVSMHTQQNRCLKLQNVVLYQMKGANSPEPEYSELALTAQLYHSSLWHTLSISQFTESAKSNYWILQLADVLLQYTLLGLCLVLNLFLLSKMNRTPITLPSKWQPGLFLVWALMWFLISSWLDVYVGMGGKRTVAVVCFSTSVG